MKSLFDEILKALHVELEAIDMESCNISIEESEYMIDFLNEKLKELRSCFVSLEDVGIQDEITFFKETKPEILGFLLYFNKIHTIELKCPNGSNDTLKDYYDRELKNLTCFFESNLDFYQYYRSKATYMDEFYFLRNRKSYKLCVDYY